MFFKHLVLLEDTTKPEPRNRKGYNKMGEDMADDKNKK